MKKLLVHLLTLLYILTMTVYWDDAYNPVSGVVVCFDGCWHEVGHAVDQRSGWVSETEDFQMAVFVHAQVGEDGFAERLAGFPGVFGPRWFHGDPFTISFYRGWGGFSELYADLLAWAEGDRGRMPARFRRFYDWDLVDRYGIAIMGRLAAGLPPGFAAGWPALVGAVSLPVSGRGFMAVAKMELERVRFPDVPVA